MRARQVRELPLAELRLAPTLNGPIPVIVSIIGGEPCRTASARDLHTFLEVGKDFSTWIKARIEQYGFAENVDFCSADAVPQKGGVGNRGARIEYLLTLDMAKELAMVERNVKGKEARQYFIECERRALVPPPLPNFADPAAAARAWADEVEAGRAMASKAAQLEHQVSEQAPAVAGFDLIANADGTMCIRDAAKTLQLQPSRLTTWLITSRWIYHRPGKAGYLAYQEKIQSGHLTHKSGTYKDPETGEHKISEQVRITGKGLATLASKLTAPPGQADPPRGSQASLNY